MNLERFKKISGKQIYENLPIEKIENFRIHYPETLTENGQRLTDVSITIDGENYFGQSACSKKDIFSKKKGRKIALIKACKQFWKSNYALYI